MDDSKKQPSPYSGADRREAPKADAGKPRTDLVPGDAILGMAEVLRFGAAKYEAWSWARGKAWSKDYASAQRHMLAWQGGEELDPESGLPHLWHAMTDLAFIVASQKRGLGTDDRHRWPVEEKEAAPLPPPPAVTKWTVEQIADAREAENDGFMPCLDPNCCDETCQILRDIGETGSQPSPLSLKPIDVVEPKWSDKQIADARVAAANMRRMGYTIPGKLDGGPCSCTLCSVIRDVGDGDGESGSSS
jgi:hypothetical protein